MVYNPGNPQSAASSPSPNIAFQAVVATATIACYPPPLPCPCPCPAALGPRNKGGSRLPQSLSPPSREILPALAVSAISEGWVPIVASRCVGILFELGRNDGERGGAAQNGSRHAAWKKYRIGGPLLGMVPEWVRGLRCTAAWGWDVTPIHSMQWLLNESECCSADEDKDIAYTEWSDKLKEFRNGSSTRHDTLEFL
ncbi:hypothetical protein J1614_003332 [Plenodomus biglobosus]|nr:hypothetical protein J1614_003332 [Plenodomus biglobosus]